MHDMLKWLLESALGAFNKYKMPDGVPFRLEAPPPRERIQRFAWYLRFKRRSWTDPVLILAKPALVKLSQLVPRRESPVEESPPVEEARPVEEALPVEEVQPVKEPRPVKEAPPSKREKTKKEKPRVAKREAVPKRTEVDPAVKKVPAKQPAPAKQAPAEAEKAPAAEKPPAAEKARAHPKEPILKPAVEKPAAKKTAPSARETPIEERAVVTRDPALPQRARPVATPPPGSIPTLLEFQNDVQGQQQQQADRSGDEALSGFSRSLPNEEFHQQIKQATQAARNFKDPYQLFSVDDILDSELLEGAEQTSESEPPVFIWDRGSAHKNAVMKEFEKKNDRHYTSFWVDGSCQAGHDSSVAVAYKKMKQSGPWRLNPLSSDVREEDWTIHGYKTHEELTPQETELLAILHSLWEIHTETQRLSLRAGQGVKKHVFAIFSDGKFWLQHIKYFNYNYENGHPPETVSGKLCKKIIDLCENLKGAGARVELHWIAGHSMIPGNELAHNVARAGSTRYNNPAPDSRYGSIKTDSPPDRPRPTSLPPEVKKGLFDFQQHAWGVGSSPASGSMSEREEQSSSPPEESKFTSEPQSENATVSSATKSERKRQSPPSHTKIRKFDPYSSSDPQSRNSKTAHSALPNEKESQSDPSPESTTASTSNPEKTIPARNSSPGGSTAKPTPKPEKQNFPHSFFDGVRRISGSLSRSTFQPSLSNRTPPPPEKKDEPYHQGNKKHGPEYEQRQGQSAGQQSERSGATSPPPSEDSETKTENENPPPQIPKNQAHGEASPRVKEPPSHVRVRRVESSRGAPLTQAEPRQQGQSSSPGDETEGGASKSRAEQAEQSQPDQQGESESEPPQ